MAKIVAKFSDGSTDEYKGKREVKAAWQVKLTNGTILSGHSFDMQSAQTTARANASARCNFREIPMHRATIAAFNNDPDYAEVRSEFGDIRRYNEAMKRRRIAYMATCKYEFVSLEG